MPVLASKGKTRDGEQHRVHQGSLLDRFANQATPINPAAAASPKATPGWLCDKNHPTDKLESKSPTAFVQAKIP
jgi:hypothetical protein